MTADPYLHELTESLTYLTRAGYDATKLVRSAAASGPLPDDHPAAALWRRIVDQLPPQTPKLNPTTPKAAPGDKSHQYEVTRPTATLAALGGASHVGPEPLKASPPDP